MVSVCELFVVRQYYCDKNDARYYFFLLTIPASRTTRADKSLSSAPRRLGELSWYHASTNDYRCIELSAEMKDLHAVVQCLKVVDRESIINVGLALGLDYIPLNEMKRCPHDMVLAWLQQKDNVKEQTGEPTAQSLIQALEESDLTGTADIVKSKFNIS